MFKANSHVRLTEEVSLRLSLGSRPLGFEFDPGSEISP